jgi:protein PET100
MQGLREGRSRQHVMSRRREANRALLSISPSPSYPRPSIHELSIPSSLHQVPDHNRVFPSIPAPQPQKWPAPTSRSSKLAPHPLRTLHTSDILQFGMYILFPISIMYYFGTNLEGRFSVPEFWPKPGQTHKIPYDREEIAKELERIKARNLENKRRREEREMAAAREEGGS